MVRVGLVRCHRGGRRLRLKPARPGRCHGPAMPAGWRWSPTNRWIRWARVVWLLMNRSALWVVSVRVTLFQRMSMSGWWLAASAASATRLTNRVADRKWP